MPEPFSLVLLTAMVAVSGLAAIGRILAYLRSGVTYRRFPWLWCAATLVNYPLGHRSTADWTLFGILVVLFCFHVSLWSIGRQEGAK